MATGTIKSFAIPETEVKTGTGITLTVPTNAYTNVMSVTLTPGTWLILAHGAFENAFETQFIMAIRRGSSTLIYPSVVRGTGSAGGGLHTAIVETVSSETTYNLAYWQGSGSSQSVMSRDRAMWAIRLR